MGRALLVMDSDHNRRKAVDWIGKAPVGTRVEFKASKRTLPQNDLLWALLTEVSQQLELGGKKYDPSQWKAIFLHAFGREVSFLPSLDQKTFLPIELSSSDLSKDEMTDFIEFIFKESAERGVIFKDPREQTNSNPADHYPDDQSGSGDPLQSPETDEAEASPSTSASSPLSEAKLRQHLMDFARKAFSTAADKHLTAEQKVGFIDDMRANIKRELPEPTWGKFNTIRLAAERVVQFPHELSERRASIARDFLDCSPADIGGSANG